MRLWLSCLLLLCAAHRIDCQAAAELIFKSLTAIDETDDVLKIYFHGKNSEDFSTAKYFHLQIDDITPGTPTLPMKPLEVDTKVEIGTSKIYCLSFDYKSLDGVTGINEIKHKKLTLELIIKLTLEATDMVGYGTIDADLTGVDVFPSNTLAVLPYILDSKSNDGSTGRWIRIDEVTTSPVIGGPTDIPTCETNQPCYTYENAVDGSVNKYYTCKDVTAALKSNEDKLYLCSSEESVPTDITKIDAAVPDQIILDHANNLEVTIKDEKNAVKIDLVVHKSTDQPTKCTKDIPATLTDPVSCAITFTPEDKSEYKILLVGYAGDTIMWTNDYTSNDHNLKNIFVSKEILEVSWDHDEDGDIQLYFVKRNKVDNADAAYLETIVDCSAVGDPCISYFVDIKYPGKYAVTLQDCDSSGCTTAGKNLVSIKAVEVPQPTKKMIVIHDETIETKVSDQNIIVEVCFDQLKNISLKDTHYEFLVINNKGQWKREKGVNMKSDSHVCFNSVELALTKFKENSKAFVLLRDTRGGNILASEEVKLRISDHTGDKMGNTSDNTVWIIVGTSAGVLTCLVALIALIHTKIIRRNENDDGIQYPLHRSTIENPNFTLGSNTILGLDNPLSTL